MKLNPLPLTSRAWAEIDLSAIARNVARIRQHIGPHRQFMAVVKADAYGHGLRPVAQAAWHAGATWLGVATVAEGVALREANLTCPIALLCAFAPEESAAVLHYDLTPALGDRATLHALETARRARQELSAPRVHLEIETGMGRAGVLPDEAVALWQAATAADLRVDGLSTHFADADSVDAAFTRQQETLFQETFALLTNAGARFNVIHCSNSAATWRGFGASGVLARPGLLLYGIRPPHCEPDSAAALHDLEPALTLKARIGSVRELPQGHAISYGATHTLMRASRVATVLIGYGDGLPRRLSNVGTLLVRGRHAPILGRVCMDQTIVDVTDIAGVEAGETAVFIGAQGAERITVEALARQIGTTEHEITTALTARVPRRYQPATPVSAAVL